MNKLRKLGAAAAIMATALSSPGFAQAWLNTNGNISSVVLSYPGNFSFRVVLNSAPTTGCNNGFLYINTSNGNYQAYVATLLSAYAQQKKVIIYYSPDATGFCQMTDIGF